MVSVGFGKHHKSSSSILGGKHRESRMVEGVVIWEYLFHFLSSSLEPRNYGLGGNILAHRPAVGETSFSGGCSPIINPFGISLSPGGTFE